MIVYIERGDLHSEVFQFGARVKVLKEYSGNILHLRSLFIMMQASSEHPLGQAILEYARHFHFFDEPSNTNDTQSYGAKSKFSGWLHDVSDFSALPGRGVQCFIGGKMVLVSICHSCFCAKSD